ncbi:unnamed protein product [marine sediment metagenome]|uniref:Uncharacterized protein n=1 Tax=marine sediment metagenome TaxID=412755 RepID=X1HHE5_9ZZZZ
MIKKIVSIAYKENGFFSHPKNKEEFLLLTASLKVAFENKDITGIMVSACQLIPDEVCFEDEEV